MSFNDLAASGAADIFQGLGEPVTYKGGTPQIQAIIDKDVFAVGDDRIEVGERRTEINLLVNDAPNATRGDTVVSASQTYTLQDELDNDGVAARWSAK